MKETNIFVILYDALLNYPKTIRVISYKFRKMLAYAFVLAAIVGIPNFISTIQIFDILETNATAVTDRIPDYELANGKIESSDSESFIYQTDLITYAFDKDDQISSDEVTSNDNLITLENNSDNVTLSFMGQPVAFTYEQLGDSATSDGLKSLVTGMTTLSWGYYPLLFLIVAVSYLLNILIAGLLISLVIGFLPDSTRLRLTFPMRLHLALTSMTMPLIVITVFNLVGMIIPFQFEIMYVFAVFRLWRLLKKVQVIKMNK